MLTVFEKGFFVNKRYRKKFPRKDKTEEANAKTKQKNPKKSIP